jgi:hypothetical protein
MKNIHILPTSQPSKILKDLVDKTYQFKKEVSFGNRIELPLNIYITSDVDIEEGEEFWYNNGGEWYKAIYRDYYKNLFPYGKKIILTTDDQLIKDNVQAIDDKFLEWFVKNPSCENVGIEPLIAGFVDDEPSYYENMYDIIIPQEEPKRKIDTCYNFDMEIGCVQDICRCEQEEFNIVRLPPYYESKEESIEDIKLEEVCGSKYCQFSVIENKLEIIYRNQEKLLTAIKLLNNGK